MKLEEVNTLEDFQEYLERFKNTEIDWDPHADWGNFDDTFNCGVEAGELSTLKDIYKQFIKVGIFK